jgi:hypothetical protein
MLILHVPGWFNMIFGLIKPMLNETMKKKVRRPAHLTGQATSGVMC